MLPKATSGHPTLVTAKPSQVEDQARSSDERVPYTIAALRSLKLRKQAIANAANLKGRDISSNTPQIDQLKAKQAELEAQRTENVQLRNDNDRMAKVIESLESLPSQIKELQNRLDAAPSDPDTHSLQTLVLELEKLRDLPSRVGQLETAAKQPPANPELQLDARLEESKNDALAQFKTAETALGKRIDDDHKIIVSLSSGFNTLNNFKKAIEEQKISDQLVGLSETIKELEQTVNKVEQRVAKVEQRAAKVEHNEQKTYERALDTADDLAKFHRDVADFIGPIQKEFDRDSTNLVYRIETLELDNKQTMTLEDRFKKLESTQNSIAQKKAVSDTVVEQLKTLQTEQGRLSQEQTKLKSEQDSLSKGAKELAAKMDKLEQKAQAPANTRNDIANTQRLDKLEHDVKELHKTCQDQVAHVDERLKVLDKHSEELYSLAAQGTRFRDSLTTLDVCVADQMLLQAQVNEIQTRATTNAEPQPESRIGVRAEQGRPSDAPSIDASVDIAEIHDTLEQIEKDLHQHSIEIKVLTDVVPGLFTNKFDPFKQEMEQRHRQVDLAFDEIRKTVARLKQQPPPITQAPPESTSAKDVTAFKQEIAHLRGTLEKQTSLQEQEIGDVKQQLAQKIDSVSVEDMMDQFKVGFQGLQTQYNNITTDELHGRMVKWFLQSFPSNTASMVQQYASIQQEVHGLQALSGQISWFQSNSHGLAPLLESVPQLQALLKLTPHLEALLNVAPQLVVLLQSNPELQQMPQIASKVDQACKDAQEALTKIGAADTKTNEHIQAIDTTTRRLENFTAQAVRDMSAGLQRLQTSIKEETEARVGENHKIRHSLEAFAAVTMQLTQGVRDLQATSLDRGRDIDTINKDFVEPNRELFAMFPHIIRYIGQMQDIVEQLNQNLPKGPLTFQWHRDLRPFGGKDVDVNDGNINGANVNGGNVNGGNVNGENVNGGNVNGGRGEETRKQ
jgi:DNA repair exonuclease SbcCD ATPase subunit